MLRAILQRLSRGRSFKRKLPARFGATALYVSPDSQLKYLKPGSDAFDAGLLRIIDENIREDSVVWDIGSNVGVFAFAAASIARKGSTLAVEADTWLAQLIRQSILLKQNRGLNIQVLPCAMADRIGVADFVIANRGRASNYLKAAGGRSQAGGHREKVTVPTLTLDTLLDFFTPPTFLKIDVEGAEAIVLRGANRLLSGVRPTIYIEVGTDATAEVTRILTEKRYSLFDGSKPWPQQTAAQSCAFDTLAVPQEIAAAP